MDDWDTARLRALRALPVQRRLVLEQMSENGISELDTQIASRAGLMLGTTLMELKRLEQAGLVCGNGNWWHRTGLKID